MMRRFWALLLFFHSAAPSDVILHAPRNTALVANDVLRITCGTNSSRSHLRWSYTPCGSNIPILMNDRETATLERFREFGLIPGHNGSYDLYTSSVRIHHSGIYTCKVAVNQENDQADLLSASAHLIVLQSTPICETSQNMKNDFVAEGQVIKMSCRVQFSGNKFPVMNWIQKPKDSAKGGFTDHIGNGSITTRNNDSVTSTLELIVTSSMNGLSFVCETYFDGTPYFEVWGIDFANNTPEYRATWTIGPLNVSFGPRNITFLPKLEVFSVGDQVTCSADGNPPPTYEWKELETGFTTSGEVLTVEKFKSSQKAIYKFQCTAKNNLSLTEVVLIFTIEDLSDSLPTSVVGGLSAIIGVLLVVIVGGFLIYRRQNKTSRNHGRERFEKDTEAEGANTNDSQPPDETTDQSLDLISTSSSSPAGRSSHTYSDIEDQSPDAPSPLGNYNELMVDHREQNKVSLIYLGLGVMSEHDQPYHVPIISGRDPGTSTPAIDRKSADYYNICGEKVSSSQEHVSLQVNVN